MDDLDTQRNDDHMILTAMLAFWGLLLGLCFAMFGRMLARILARE